jgi:hypothetical protein
MRHDGAHLHARPFSAKRQPRANRQQPAEEFDRYQIGRRRRQLLIQRRLDMRDAAPGSIGRKPPDQPRRSRNRQPGPAGHQQEAAEPAVVGERDHPVAEPIGFLERQPEGRTDQPRRPARDQRQKGEREETAGLLFGSDVRVRAGLHRGVQI